MQVWLRVLAVLFTSLCLTLHLAQAQTPGAGWVNITGLLQGPIYPCGNSTCPTYDSGQITVTVNGFNATTNYSKAGSQKTATQLANALATKLNAAASPVTAIVTKSKITMTAKFAGSLSNYLLSTSVTYNAQFAKASFTATASGPVLTGGSGGPVSIGTLAQQTSNNTSLCSSSNDPGGNFGYCSTFFDGFAANPNDIGIQTLVPGAPAGHVSNISIKQLVYSGWSGRLICEYQLWFGSSNHKSVGYNENSPATVAAQNSFMLAEGCNINLVDYYGSLDAKQSFNLTTTNAVFADLNGRAGYPLKFGIMEDKGALKSTCPTSGQTEVATVTCLQNALTTEMDYINTHYANSLFRWQGRLADPDFRRLGFNLVNCQGAHRHVLDSLQIYFPIRFIYRECLRRRTLWLASTFCLQFHAAVLVGIEHQRESRLPGQPLQRRLKPSVPADHRITLQRFR